MKKCIRLTALLLVLVMTVGLACGCSSKKEDEGQTVYAHLTVGIPHDMDSAVLEQIKTMIGSIESESGFSFYEDTVVELVPVPAEGTKEYDKFIKNVYNNKIDIFLGNFSEGFVKLIEDKKIATNIEITDANSMFSEPQIASQAVLSREYNRVGYHVPVIGSYQGVFMNTDVFANAEIAIPTDWATLNDAIAKLKEKGITPFVAGFADGAEYWLDEMILSEGGVAEHSAVPSKGVVSSWQRAVNDIKKLYNDGAFNKDVLTATHADAVQRFINKDAAMIVCSSKDLGAGVDGESVTYMTMPVTNTGIKKAGTYIGQSEMGFYINSKSLFADVDDVTKLCAKLIALVVDNFANPEWYAKIFDKEGYFPFYKDNADTCMDSALEQAAWKVISNNDADVPMSNYLLPHEDFESGLVDVLENEVSVKDYLLNITEKQINALAEQKALKDKK